MIEAFKFLEANWDKCMTDTDLSEAVHSEDPNALLKYQQSITTQFDEKFSQFLVACPVEEFKDIQRQGETVIQLITPLVETVDCALKAISSIPNDTQINTDDGQDIHRDLLYFILRIEPLLLKFKGDYSETEDAIKIYEFGLKRSEISDLYVSKNFFTKLEQLKETLKNKVVESFEGNDIFKATKDFELFVKLSEDNTLPNIRKELAALFVNAIVKPNISFVQQFALKWKGFLPGSNRDINLIPEFSNFLQIVDKADKYLLDLGKILGQKDELDTFFKKRLAEEFEKKLQNNNWSEDPMEWCSLHKIAIEKKKKFEGELQKILVDKLISTSLLKSNGYFQSEILNRIQKQKISDIEKYIRHICSLSKDISREPQAMLEIKRNLWIEKGEDEICRNFLEPKIKSEIFDIAERLKGKKEKYEAQVDKCFVKLFSDFYIRFMVSEKCSNEIKKMIAEFINIFYISYLNKFPISKEIFQLKGEIVGERKLEDYQKLKDLYIADFLLFRKQCFEMFDEFFCVENVLTFIFREKYQFYYHKLENKFGKIDPKTMTEEIKFKD